MKRYYTSDEKKAIFFDMNDTIMDSRAALRTGFVKALEEFTARWAGESQAWDPQKSFSVYHKTMRKWRRNQTGKAGSSNWAIPCLREALKDSPFSVNERMLQLIHERINQIKKETAIAFPGVQDAIKELSARYKLAIITNGNREQRMNQLTGMGLDAFIPREQLFTPAKTNEKKPSTVLFRHAMEQIGVSPKESVMVGNSWRNDIYGATRAGMDAIWFCRIGRKNTTRKIGKKKIMIIHRGEQLLDIFR